MDAAVGAGHAAAHHIDNERKVRLGMLFYVLTDMILVLFFFASYVWLRAYNTDGGWFPFKHMRLPDQATSNILVLLIVISAVSFYVAYRGIRAGNQTILQAGLAVAVALVLATLVWQIRFMGQQQFAALDGSFASTWIVLSGYHVYHLFLGAFLGLGLLHRALRGKYSAEHHLGLVTIGYFWYWMALMPVIFWLIMAILPPKL